MNESIPPVGVSAVRSRGPGPAAAEDIPFGRRRILVGAELAIIGGLTALVYLLATRFNWFETVERWIRSRNSATQVEGLVVAIRFLVLGLFVFAFRRWREAERETTAHRQARGELRLWRDHLELRVRQRTADLHASNEALRLQSAALTAAGNGIVITNREGAVVWANPAFTTLTGYALDEALGKDPRDLLKSGPHDPTGYQGLRETILAGHVWQEELVNRRKDGSLYPEAQTITPVRATTGEITHFVVIKQDLTERKQAEESLRLLRTLIDRSKDPFVVIDPATGRFLDVSESFCRETGYHRAELSALSVFELTVGLNRARFETVNARLREADSLRLEGSYRRKDGSIFPMEVNLSLVTLDREYVVTFVRNIADRRLAERQLREQNEILSNAHEGVMIVSLANEISLWNRGAEALFGWSAAEARGRRPDEVLGICDPDALPTLRTAVDRDGHWNGELQAQSRDGRKLVVDCRVTLVRDETGHPLAQLGFFADVTEKKLLEEKFLHAQRLENLGLLASGVAHDLNNMLAPIMLAGPLLRRSLTAEGDLKILAMLERSAERGTALVRQILGFAHGTDGKFRPTPVKHLARDIVDMIQGTFPKTIQFEYHIPPDLWSVIGNPSHLHQILLNLCVNARDAMPAGGKLTLRVENRRLDAKEAEALPGARAGAWVVLEVSDSGIGIPPGALAHIWEPFFTTKGPGRGTGLGLSTVRGIVTSHHGFIALETQVGHGTTFRIHLPAVPEEPVPTGGTAVEATPAGRGELILVADDDPAIRDSISAILMKQGYRVVCADDGVDAVDLFNRHANEVALVLTDMDMPLLGGPALARILANLRPGLPVLAMSGLDSGTDDADHLAATDSCIDDFLLKPFTADTLLAAVYPLLEPPDSSPTSLLADAH